MSGVRRIAIGWVMCVVIGLAFAAPSASADLPFTVNTTGDGPDAALGDHICDTQPAVAGAQCSLRAAIGEADTTAGSDTIVFSIPGSGVKTIDPHSELPHITAPVLINGYTQGASTPNTESLGQGDNANLLVELSGANTADTSGISGLTVDPGGAGTLIEGLVVNRFSVSGLLLKADATIQGNFIGTGPAGVAAHGVGFDGIFNDAHAQVGGVAPSARNVISGNGRDGVSGNGTATVQGNYIGTQRDGESPLPNAESGIRLFSTGSTIGGVNAGNVIAFNVSDGITMFNSSQNNPISRNRIFSNGGSGIDLFDDGRTPNDALDADTGPNELQNFPAVASATHVAGGPDTVAGHLSSTPSQQFTIEFFENPPGGNEGAKFIGQTIVTTNGTGIVSYAFHPGKPIAVGDGITATATNVNHSTSELSGARKVVSG